MLNNNINYYDNLSKIRIKKSYNMFIIFRNIYTQKSTEFCKLFDGYNAHNNTKVMQN